MAGKSSAMTEAVESVQKLARWGNPEHGIHRKVWGFAGLAPRISTIPPHIGAAAGKRGRRWERQGSRRKPLGDSQISGFFSP